MVRYLKITTLYALLIQVFQHFLHDLSSHPRCDTRLTCDNSASKHLVLALEVWRVYNPRLFTQRA